MRRLISTQKLEYVYDCLHREEALNDWEKQFLHSVVKIRSLSEKQLATLKKIHSRVVSLKKRNRELVLTSDCSWHLPTRICRTCKEEFHKCSDGFVDECQDCYEERTQK